MSECHERPFADAVSARLSTADAHDGLSPAVRAVVTDALDPRAQSLPLAFVRATAAAAPSNRESDPGAGLLEEAGAALVALGGYARVRASVLSADREAADRERTVRVLASDYLLALAHRTVGGAAASADRRLACYRVLTAGSSSLPEAFFVAGAAEPAADGSTGPTSPAASLAGTGSALGGAVVGASREVVDAMATVGESLVAATEAADGGDDRLERLEGVLTGRAGTAAAGDGPLEPRAADAAADGRAASHLERARRALETLPASAARDRLVAAAAVPVGGDVERE